MLENKRKGFSDEKIKCPCCGKPMNIEDCPDIFVNPHLDKIIEHIQTEYEGKTMKMTDFKHLILYTRLNSKDIDTIANFLSSQGFIKRNVGWVTIL